MSVLKDIKAAQLQARKDKLKFRAGILTSLMSEVAIIGKNQGIEETLDADALKVITKFKKGVTETKELLRKKDKDTSIINRLKSLDNETDLYDEFLPKLMSEDELKTSIEVIVSQGANNIGMVMGKLKAEYAGLYDGHMASGLIKAALN